MLKRQIKDLTNDPEQLKKLPHEMTIYHRLLDKHEYKDKKVPSPLSLYHEAQALMFAGGDTVANALMLGFFHLLRQREQCDKLRQELQQRWPSLESRPSLRELESLKYLDAVIKESLRLSSGVTSGLLRVVPAEGATICGVQVPGEVSHEFFKLVHQDAIKQWHKISLTVFKTVVSCGSTFVHYNPDIFPNPHTFRPERWLDRADLDNWLVAFSKGPRMCLGIKYVDFPRHH